MNASHERPCLMRAWHAHEHELRVWLVARLEDSTQAQDLLQEVFVKALRQGQRFCDVSNSRAWLYEVTRNTLTDYWRKHRSTDALDDAMPEPEQEPPSAVDTLVNCLPRVLTELNETDRDAITACDLNGMSQEAYAQRAGITLAAAKSRVQRARHRLKTQLMTSCKVVLDDKGMVCDFTSRNTSPHPS